MSSANQRRRKVVSLIEVVAKALRKYNWAVKFARRIGLPDVVEPIRRFFYEQHIICKQVDTCRFKMLIDNPVAEFWYESDSGTPMNTKYFCNFLREGDVVVDAGAHHGLYSLLSSRYVGERGRVFAFEPLPSNYRTLIKNIAMNGADNVEAFNLAVAHKRGRARFNKYNDGMMSDYGRMEVDVVALTDVIETHIDVLKVDVEGAEYEVLLGAQPLLSESTRIFCEVHPDRLEYFGRNTSDLIRLLAARGGSLKYWTWNTDAVIDYDGRPIVENSFLFVCPDETRGR